MSAKRRSVHLAWPGALLACALATVSCGEDPEAPFVTGGGGNRRDGGNDDDTDGGLGGNGGGGGGVGGTTDDPFEGFTRDNWVAGDPTGLDPEKVYIIVELGDEKTLLDLPYPGGDPAADIGRRTLSDDYAVSYSESPSTIGVYPSTRMRPDGALIHRDGKTSLYVVNYPAGDVKIAKCVVGGDTHWLLHPKLGSVIYQCRTVEDETVTRHYQSITAIGEDIDYYREHLYPIPEDYMPLLVGPDGDQLLRVMGQCETMGCTEFYVLHDEELITVPLPSTYFYSRLIFFRNTEGGFHLLVHNENFFDVPPLPDPLPPLGVVLPPMYFPPVALQLWKISYEGEMTKVRDFDGSAFFANNCDDQPDEVFYPVDDATGYVDYTLPPIRRTNACRCALTWDGSALCASSSEAHFMGADGSNGMLYSTATDEEIGSVITGP